MPAKNIGSIINIYDVMSSTLDNHPDEPGTLGTNTLTCQLGDAISGTVYTDSAEIWNPTGLAARPSDFVSGGDDAAQAISIARADHDIVIATRDVRTQQILGNLNAGETCLYATGTNGGAQSRVLLKQDGSITLFTTDTNDSDGNGIYLKIATNKFEFRAPWGRMTFDVSGFHISTQSGAAFDLNNLTGLSIGGLGLTNNARITSQQTSIDSPNILLGPSAANGGGVFFPAVYGYLPPVAGVPILGVGVGAVTVNASASTKVMISV